MNFNFFYPADKYKNKSRNTMLSWERLLAVLLKIVFCFVDLWRFWLTKYIGRGAVKTCLCVFLFYFFAIYEASYIYYIIFFAENSSLLN